MLKTYEYVRRFQICYLYLYLFEQLFQNMHLCFIHGLCVESSHIIKNTSYHRNSCKISKPWNAIFNFFILYVKYGTYVLISKKERYCIKIFEDFQYVWISYIYTCTKLNLHKLKIIFSINFLLQKMQYFSNQPQCIFQDKFHNFLESPTGYTIYRSCDV